MNDALKSASLLNKKMYLLSRFLEEEEPQEMHSQAEPCRYPVNIKKITKVGSVMHTIAYQSTLVTIK